MRYEDHEDEPDLRGFSVPSASESSRGVAVLMAPCFSGLRRRKFADSIVKAGALENAAGYNREESESHA